MPKTHSAIGIDFGSSRFIIAAAKRGGVDVIANEVSYRSTPCLVTYGEQRMIGDRAVSGVKRDLKNAIFYPIRLVEELSEEVLKFEKQFNFASIRTNENGKTVVEVNVKGEKKLYTAEQVLAGLFTEVIDVLALNGINEREAVITVPAVSSHVARQAIIDAASIAGIKITKLLHESSAVLTDYGIFRKSDLAIDSYRTVAFVDVGFSKTSAYVAHIWKDKADILYEASVSTVGVRNIDLVLLDFHKNNFQTKYKLDIEESPKSIYRLLEGIERQRKILSSNLEAPINVECLCEDIDYSYTMKRDEFESLITNITSQIAYVFNQVAQFIKDKGEKLHSVERIGGGTRIPLIENEIMKAFGVSTISKTLDANESIAKGAAIQAAALSPVFKVVPYRVSEKILLPIAVALQYEGEQPISKILFPVGTEIGKVFSVGITKTLPLSVKLLGANFMNNDPLRVLMSSEVEVPQINPISLKHESKIYFGLNANGIVSIEKGELKETLPSENNEEGKEAKEKIRVSELVIKHLYKVGSTNNEMTSYITEEADANASVRKIREDQQAKYKLESKCYQLKDKLKNQKLLSLVEPNIQKNILEEISKMENWLYGEGSNAEKNESQKQLHCLENVSKPFLDRLSKIDDSNYLIEEANLYFNQFANEYQSDIKLAQESQKSEINRIISNAISETGHIKTILENISIKSIDSFDLNAKKSTLDNARKALEEIINEIRKTEKLKKEAELKAQKIKKEEEAKAKKEAEDKTKSETEAKANETKESSEMDIEK